MSKAAVSLSILVCMSSIGAAQKPSTTTRISACSLISKDLMLKATPGDKRFLDSMKPDEQPLGESGSACDYGGIGLQIDPFTPTQFEELRKSMAAQLEPVAGVGDAAYFRNNKNLFAELMGRVGSHTFTVQLSIPIGSSAAAVKPNTVMVANAIIPKLK